MKKWIAFAGLLCSICSFAQTEAKIAIIPQPVSVVQKPGFFTMPQNITIHVLPGQELQPAVQALQLRLATATGKKIAVSPTAANATIKLHINKTANPAIGMEGYQLQVTPQQVAISANAPAGLFYGVQTLLQLLPKEIESAQAVNDVEWKLPVVEITDFPRFVWRGLMFDVSRHFFTKEEVKQFIDNMVRYKYNLLHLHLTDDEGWRIEIKGYPRLTEIGAWNVKKEGYFGTFSPPANDEPRTYGGFYTQNDIKELVQYASERFVNILPEIDVPGHSLAAVASYPELSCTPEASSYKVRSGERIMDWSHGAPPIALVDNTLCPANEKVYVFLDTVMAQLAHLFPFQYIHVGGDETPQNFWKKTPAILQLMKKEGLKDMHEVQGYFERRVENIVRSKGKKLIGWDEIVEAGVAPSAAVMSWRGTKFGIQAANAGHKVVMSPSTYAYLDYMQGDSIMEPRVYASLRLNKTYEFDPAPKGVNSQNILGGQGNLWTEQLYNMRTVEYMLWPRAFAVAEAVWTPVERKNWVDFVQRVEQHFDRFDVAETKYSPALYDPIFDITKGSNNQPVIKLTTEIPGLDIYYSFDNSFPDRFYPKYTQPLMPPKDAAMLKVITYRGAQPVGRMMVMPMGEIYKRAGIK